MHALKPSSLFRPSSRPSSPAPAPSRPDSAASAGIDRAPRSIARLSLTNFRRPSPAPSPSPSTNIAIVQDGSYLEVLSLRLSEAVSKALAQPSGPATVQDQVLSGKRPIPAGRGRALGSIISTELNASKGNAHLRKAILRTLQRPLSTLLTNLSQQLPPLLSSSAFLTPPVPTPQAPNPNSTQAHALALATFAGELLETFDELGLGLEADARGDGLKAIRESLVSVTTRVVNPLTAGIKEELFVLIRALEELRLPSPTPNGPTALRASASSKTGTVLHPSVVTLQTVMPIYSRALARYFATSATQANLATLEISLVWRALAALAHRIPPPPTPPSSPQPFPGKKLRTVTPPTTPPSTRFILKLPPSRPPSPPADRQVPAVIADARAIFDLLSTMPRPNAEKEATRLAREAVDDAFDGLKALISLLESIQSISVRDPTELGVFTSDLPTLIALPILLNAYVFPAHSAGARTVAALLGFTEDQYRQGCLTGFGRAEECTSAVGQRVLDVLQSSAGVAADPAASAVVEWLKVEVAAADT
ncbi:hypothetical protein FA95DRAFT_1511461 [Auriscalpium vulgare]|uniref:Uncharacterized protein n=1 Tax=Auriscalpium vulgare TaxID=40419 RepID=A0ACB8S693_9AGAM|nr:hypothetical protein FA95DRAFT_1511461 [Auriscalpium vulgare]